MTREEILNEVLKINTKYLCLELATSVGKSRMAIEWLCKLKVSKVLVVVPRLVLIQNFKDEVTKWGKQKELSNLIFSTYISLPKHDLSEYDVVVFDEAHHLSNRCLEHVKNNPPKRAILLSATIVLNKREDLKVVFPNIYFYKVSLSNAIVENILPSPTIYLLPLCLSTTTVNQEIIVHKDRPKKIVCAYKDRKKYMFNPTIELTIKCTQQEKYDYISEQIEFWKDKYMISRNEYVKNHWLSLALKRLKYLSSLKTPLLKQVLSYLKDYRTLTFCNSIGQTEEVGKYCINSKNKKSREYLQAFNEGKINHITAVNILNEGVNLASCRIGIWGVMNSSPVMTCQKIGRILRHKSPVIIIPYYKDTREEDLVNKLIEGFDTDTKIIKLVNIKQLQL